MRHFVHSVSLVVFLGLVLMFAGCAKPPDAEKAAAKAAMDAAASAGAEKFASADFSTAKGLWDTAEKQVGEKKYKEAKQGYIDAKAAFDKAAQGVEAGKKAAADAANSAIAALEEAWKNLEATVKQAAKKLKDKKEAWEADAKSFTEGLQAAKDMIAADPTGAKAKADELKTSIVDKWDATMKELAGPAAPAAPAAPAKK